MTSAAPLTPNRLLMGLLRPYRWRVGFGGAVILMNAAVMVAIPQVLKYMFDHALLTGDRTALARLAGIMLGLTGVMVVGIVARGQLLRLTGVFITYDLQMRMTRHLLNLDTDWFEARHSGEVLSRLIGDVRLIRIFVADIVPMLVRGLITGGVSLGALVLTSPQLAGVLLLAGLPMAAIGIWLGRKLRRYAKLQTDWLAQVSGWTSEMASQPVTIKTYGQQETVVKKVSTTLLKMVALARVEFYSSSGLVASNIAIGFMALTGVVWLGGLQVMDHRMTLGDMTAFLLYLGFLADGVGNVGNFYPAWQSMLGGLERICEILNARGKIASPARPVALPTAKKGRTIEFAKVRYAYPVRVDENVLADVGLKIPAGAKVALVGPSGAGKSTLLRLMLRLADVKSGAVKIDGVDVRKLEVRELRHQFALVAQDAPLFSGSVRENVAFGRPGASDDEIWAALKVAHAMDFVRALPDGLDTAVGERGVQLSGGQRQRVAIARAVLVDAPVLLLDEATSHLDSDSERAVQAALEEAGRGRTVVAIAHRLSTVREADVIFVIDGGRVVASGTHAKLMKSSELYRGLASLQLKA